MLPGIGGALNVHGNVQIKVDKFRIISILNFISVKQESYTAFVIYFLILVGGIYTVIRSKTSVSVNEMGDQYVCIGPYVEMKARAEVEEEDFPPHHPLGIFYFIQYTGIIKHRY